MTRIDRTTAVLVGVGVVGIAAAVPSLAGLTGLAMRTGWATPLAPLLPISVDAAGIVASLVWLDPDQARPVRRYARAVVMTALLVSVAGNAGDHALAALAVVAPLWLVLAVAAISPIALASTAHLAALLVVDRDRHAVVGPAVADEPVEAVDSIESAPTAPPIEASPPAAAEHSDSTDLARSTQVSATVEADPLDRSRPRSRSVEDLLGELDRLVDDPAIEVNPASGESIRRALRVGPPKARAVRDAYAARTRPHIVHSA